MQTQLIRSYNMHSLGALLLGMSAEMWFLKPQHILQLHRYMDAKYKSCCDLKQGLAACK